jgi:hypothetical protein
MTRCRNIGLRRPSGGLSKTGRISIRTGGPARAIPATVVAIPATVVAIPATVAAIPATVAAIPATVAAIPATVVAIPATVVAIPATVAAIPATVVAIPATVGPHGREDLTERPKRLAGARLPGDERDRHQPNRASLLRTIIARFTP